MLRTVGQFDRNERKIVALKEAKVGNAVPAIKSFPTMYKHMNSLLLGTGKAEGQANG